VAVVGRLDILGRTESSNLPAESACSGVSVKDGRALVTPPKHLEVTGLPDELLCYRHPELRASLGAVKWDMDTVFLAGVIDTNHIGGHTQQRKYVIPRIGRAHTVCLRDQSSQWLQLERSAFCPRGC